MTVRTAIITSYEGHYHYGVAALVNSALAIGFDGHFIVGYRDHLPPWVQTLTKVGGEEFAVAKTRINFYRDEAPRHLGYHKPFSALDIFDRFPQIDGGSGYYLSCAVEVLSGLGGLGGSFGRGFKFSESPG
jgi:hypothetical protein